MKLSQLDRTKVLSTALVNAYGPMSLTRKWVSRVDTYETRAARRLVRALHSGGPDVLYLGDSTNYPFVADGDIRPIATMLRRSLRLRSMLFLGNAGYHAGLWDAYLSLVESTTVRPVIVSSLVNRMYVDTWRRHPAYTYAEEADAIRRLDPAKHFVPRMPKPTPNPEEFTRFRELPYRTLLGEFPVGHYLKQLRRNDLSEVEKSRWWYAYLHGSEVSDGPALAQLRQMGKTLSKLGSPVIAYQGPVCVQVGTKLLGAEFKDLTERNFQIVESTFADAVGKRCTMLRTGMIFEPQQFNDASDGVEHLNGVGRRKLASMIADGLRPHLSAASRS